MTTRNDLDIRYSIHVCLVYSRHTFDDCLIAAYHAYTQLNTVCSDVYDL
jgi:hypothetical protein